MKALLNSWLIIIAALIAGGLTTPNRTSAQTLNVLRAFTNSPDGNRAGLAFIVSSNVLYSASVEGGQYGGGMVFRMNLDGTDFTNLHNFALTGAYFTNIGGAYPSSPLVLSSNMLYGVTLYGGTGGYGTIYVVNTSGTIFTNLYNFSALVEITNSDGAQPQNSLLLFSNKLYGVAPAGGTSGEGTVFSINLDGTDFTNLHNFSTSTEYDYGYSPQSELVLLSNRLYGTTRDSPLNAGGLFAINTDGTGFTNLYEFHNGDAASPVGNLALFGNILYGATQSGGNGGDGTVFKINTDGTSFAVLHNFGGSDGEDPVGGVTLSNNILYGTTAEGGPANVGVVYKLNLSITNFVVLHSFTATSGSNETNSDGAAPFDNPIIVSNLLYGTANSGGLAGCGTLFTLTLPTSPPLGINYLGSNVVLTWPTNAVGFLLQSATNPVSSIWGNVSPAPVVVNAQYAVTNAVSGSEMIYRLSQ